VIPNRCAPSCETHFLMRSLMVRDAAELTVKQGETVVRRQSLRRVRPAEMISLILKKEQTQELTSGLPLEFSIGVGRQ